MNKFIITLLLVIIPGLLFGKTVTLDEAIDIALNKTARGSMVKGNLEVAEQNYRANKINFFLPEISINGSLPTYTVDERYDRLPGLSLKGLLRSKDLNFRSFIRLNQNLITGGDLEITANLLSNDSRYPIFERDVVVDNGDTIITYVETDIDENIRRGNFSFTYTQPLLKPSEARYDLRTSRDHYEISRMIKIEEQTQLKKDVIEAYMGMLQATVAREKNGAEFKRARLKAEVDSLKYLDGVISEEDWLVSKSEALDAELSMFEANNKANEIQKELSTLIEWNSADELVTVEPTDIRTLPDDRKYEILHNWENSVPVIKAGFEFSRDERTARYQASGHGLTGDLKASYSSSAEEVEISGLTDNYDTKGWEIAVNFSYPIWDGGAATASVKSARLQAEQSRLEYEQSKQTARADIVNLVNQIDISYRRLDIMRKQIELAQNRLDIARSRYDDGQISEITLLESEADYLESRDSYLEELSHYLLNRTELAGKYVD
jgi:outer membrane protein TolC